LSPVDADDTDASDLMIFSLLLIAAAIFFFSMPLMSITPLPLLTSLRFLSLYFLSRYFADTLICLRFSLFMLLSSHIHAFAAD